MHPLFLKYWFYRLTLKGEEGGPSDLALALGDIQIDLLPPHQITAVNQALRITMEPSLPTGWALAKASKRELSCTGIGRRANARFCLLFLQAR